MSLLSKGFIHRAWPHFPSAHTSVYPFCLVNAKAFSLPHLFEQVPHSSLPCRLCAAFFPHVFREQTSFKLTLEPFIIVLPSYPLALFLSTVPVAPQHSAHPLQMALLPSLYGRKPKNPWAVGFHRCNLTMQKKSKMHRTNRTEFL